MNPLLEMRSVTKRFPGVVALDNVSLSLRKGEILSIVGENGAGKSTLVKILNGVYPKSRSEGTVVLDGKSVSFSTPADAEKAGIGMIPQEISIELDLSVMENIMLGCLPIRRFGLVDWKSARLHAEKVLDMLNVDIPVDETARKLSACFQQLVCIGRSLIHNPRILILDEPTAALTEPETAYLMDVIRGLKSKGVSSIYISHKLDEVVDISDRIVVLRDGKNVSEYEHDEINTETIVGDMIGRRLENLYPAWNPNFGDEVLSVRNLFVRHPYIPNRYIVQDIGFNLRHGEILGLAGITGSGRSEIVRSVFGAWDSEMGRLEIEGEPVVIRRPGDAIKVGIGLLTEDRKKDGFVATMSVGENLTLSILRKLSRGPLLRNSEDSRIQDEYRDRLNIKTPSLSANIVKLSGGNQQKVILAKWLMTDLKVLILDEPTRGVDVGAKSEIYKIIHSLAEKGVGIIMISSEFPELAAMCDRFLVLNKGRITQEILSDEASEETLLHAAAFG